MKLIYVTANFPTGTGETFLAPEVRELLRQGHQLLVVPRSTESRNIHEQSAEIEAVTLACKLLNGEILRHALYMAWLHPLRVLRALGLLVRGTNLVNLAKNLIVFPKALWLARLAVLRALGLLVRGTNLVNLAKRNQPRQSGEEPDRLSQGPLAGTTGRQMERRPYSRPLGGHYRHDGHGRQRSLGRPLELYGPSRRHSPGQPAGHEGSCGTRVSCV